jgi:predicted small metal-binding protein
MSKVLECSKIDPSSGCDYKIRGETEQELLQNAAVHAKQHGIREVTPDLMDRVKKNIYEE